MITINNTRLLVILLAFTSVGMLFSCKKDNNGNTATDKVELLSFGPTGAKHGDTLRFFGRNL
ncbi:MAG: hypothetical protein V4676_12325, partial [Bacteroidota bacterium]